MSTLLKIAYQPYKWLIAIPLLILNTLVMGLICILVGFFFSQDAADILAVAWSRICCAVGPVKVKIHGKRHFSRFKSYVVVANHQSMADIPALHGFIGLKIKWVMKQELRNIPVFGAACEQLGCIFVDRSNHDAAVRSIESAKEKLSKKSSVLFFAEGTRSRDGRLQPFKAGAFGMAMDLAVPILPITVRGTRDILPPGTMDLVPGTAEIIIHPPIHPAAFSPDTLQDLSRETKRVVGSGLS